MTTNKTPEEGRKSLNFIETIIEKDLHEGKSNGRIHTRFPPEPNGYLHIGHAKAICLDFGLAQRYAGKCNLRFDDTNPVKEDTEYVDSIKEDIQWLGFDWEGRLFYASDYFQQLWDFAIDLIRKGLAYVDDQPAEIISEQKGTPTQPGVESPFRNRSVEENLDLFNRMNTGEFSEGSRTLRAKIDMSSPNMHLRDPIIYRIINHPHHRTGEKWKVYPMYDFAHGQSDYFEGITHSLCTLEFEVHRPLYDWFINQLATDDYRPHQTEFNRLNLTYTVMSKRKLLQLVRENYVNGWDDPRMPTLCGLRRRGYTPESIKNFINKIGYTKYEALNDISLLESSIREDLNLRAPRVSAVLDPVKLVIVNYPEGQTEFLTAINNPEDESMGTHEIAFTRELFIEREDFMENPPKKFFRLSPGQEVRLKNAYIVRCTDVKKNETTGEIEEIYCEYDSQTRSGMPEANRKVKGTLHWVSVTHSLEAEVRLYDRLYSVENPGEDRDADFRTQLNPTSQHILKNCRVEQHLAGAQPFEHFQFQRLGYFTVDTDTEKEKRLIFNRTVSLKDSWSKEQAKKQ
ncbi:MAG: glutamine--tRNA ligase/YqeY domain fusion protein [Bacteroidales bacterium]|jgi:glutaminyl-tRNA synthetase|nr:glutamine--tRNA ligase/YqeY domain fusion protein [Bacteroidales bacterium]